MAVEQARLAGDRRAVTRNQMSFAIAALYGPMPVPTAIALCDRIVLDVGDDRRAEAVVLGALAHLNAMAGQFRLAREQYGRARDILEDLGGRLMAATVSLDSGRVELLAGDPERAERELRRDYDTLSEIDERYALSTVAALLALAVLLQSRSDEAMAMTIASEEAAAEDDVESQNLWRRIRSLILARSGRADEAVRLADEALGLIGSTDAPLLRAGTMLDRATVLVAVGRSSEATIAAHEALQIYLAKEDPVDAARVDVLLAQLSGQAGSPSASMLGGRSSPLVNRGLMFVNPDEPHDAGGSLLLWDARLIDGRGAQPRDHVAVSVEDGLVVDIEDVAGRSVPDGAVDIGGRTLLPGLIDAHAHVTSDLERSPGFGPPPPLQGEEPRPDALRWFVLVKAAHAMLQAGITTVRDVGSYDDEAIVLREAIRLGLTEGPRILTCGRIISATAPGGRIFGSMYHEADGPWGMRQAVREQLRRGADFVKVMATGARSVEREDPEPAQMTRQELEAVVDEAHRMGLRVAAHAEGLEGVRLAIETGADTIEHGLSLHREPALLERMASRGIVLVPTLTTFDDLAERFADAFAPRLVEQAKRQLEEAYLTVTAARMAGVTMAMGYDSGPPGANARELVRLVEAGLPPLEAIAAATSGSAQALGLSDRGIVEPGKVADLLVVDADPIADPAVLADRERIAVVVQGGRIVGGAAAAA